MISIIFPNTKGTDSDILVGGIKWSPGYTNYLAFSLNSKNNSNLEDIKIDLKKTHLSSVKSVFKAVNKSNNYSISFLCS
jgi:hypothetical protein